MNVRPFGRVRRAGASTRRRRRPAAPRAPASASASTSARTRRGLHRRRGALPSLGIAAVLTTLPSPTTAQTLAEQTATPDGTAEVFLRGVRAIRWDAVAAVLDEEVLGRFHQTVTMVADSDPTGELRRYLVAVDSTALVTLDPAISFARAIGAVIEDMPGLMHAMYDRDDEVIGSIREGDDLAHAVYRSIARISGAVPEVQVMQLRRRDTGWRVVWSDELETLDAALRGVPRTRR